MSASSLAGLAALDTPTGMAYRYALQELNPFVIVNSANLYDQHNANGDLDLYDPQTGDGDGVRDRRVIQKMFNHRGTEDTENEDRERLPLCSLCSLCLCG